MYELMIPGPTEVPEPVLAARAKRALSPVPSQDASFLEFYRETAARITRYANGDPAVYETVILSGEAMLALEACIASLTEDGDLVLILDNGVFGAGFADLVKMYGGTPVIYNVDWRRPLNAIAIGIYLQSNHRFKYATVVHCDTPSGMLNPLSEICMQLKRFDIPVVADAVASLFGERVDLPAGIDFLCGGTQKALSAPAGLSFVTVSPAGKTALAARKTPVVGSYTDLNRYLGYYERRAFPYTMPAHDIQGLAAALDVVEADAERLERHTYIGMACRAAVEKAGLELYPQNGYASTVTAICAPEGVAVAEIIEKMRDEHGILLADSLSDLHGKVFRIGHMGENCNKERVAKTLGALGTVLTELGVSLETDMVEVFLRRC